MSMHPKFHSHIVTQHPQDIVLWRKGSAGFKRQPIWGMSKEVGAGRERCPRCHFPNTKVLS